MFVYIITNTVNNKVYVGQTIVSLEKRWYGHTYSMRTGEKYPLYNAMRKYGLDKFNISLLAEAKDINELNLLEEQLIKEYQSIKKGYNLRKGGGNSTHSEKSIKKMSESQTRAHERRREEGRAGGWKRSDGGNMKGKTHKESTKKLQSESKKGNKNPSYGKEYSEEERKYRSEKMKEIWAERKRLKSLEAVL